MEVLAPRHKWRCLQMAGRSCSWQASNRLSRSGSAPSPARRYALFLELKVARSLSGRPTAARLGSLQRANSRELRFPAGRAIELCDAPFGRGGSWNRDNVILFAPGRELNAPGGAATGLMRVSSAGGVPTVVTTADPAMVDARHRWPHFLPDGRHFIYTEVVGAGGRLSPSQIKLSSLDTAEAGITLLQAESSVSFASGHLLFARDDTLMAQAFDPDSRQMAGDAFPVARRVSREGSRYVGASASTNGTLVYALDSSTAPRSLTWFDRTGRALATQGEPSPYLNLALSPDEKYVAITLGSASPDEREIWIMDVARKVRSRLSSPGTDRSPVWSPEGTRIAFASARAGSDHIRQQLVNGAAGDESLLDGPSRRGIRPSSWSSDGRFIAYTVSGAFPRTYDVWALPLFGDRKPVPLLQREFLEASAVFSPNGRWIAVRVGRKRPEQRLRSVISGSGWKAARVTRRRGPACVARRRQGTVLPGG